MFVDDVVRCVTSFMASDVSRNWPTFRPRQWSRYVCLSICLSSCDQGISRSSATVDWRCASFLHRSWWVFYLIFCQLLFDPVGSVNRVVVLSRKCWRLVIIAYKQICLLIADAFACIVLLQATARSAPDREREINSLVRCLSFVSVVLILLCVQVKTRLLENYQ